MAHTIECEHCGNEINIEKSIWKSISTDLNSEYVKKDAEIKAREKAVNDEKEKQNEKVSFLVAQERNVLLKKYNDAQKNQEETIKSEVDRRVALDKELLDKQIREEVKNDLQEAKQKDIENKKIRTENMRLEVTVNTMESQHQADTEMKVAEALKFADKKASEKEEHKQQEYEEKMRQLQKSIEDSHRKANQG